MKNKGMSIVSRKFNNYYYYNRMLSGIRYCFLLGKVGSKSLIYINDCVEFLNRMIELNPGVSKLEIKKQINSWQKILDKRDFERYVTKLQKSKYTMNDISNKKVKTFEDAVAKAGSKAKLARLCGVTNQTVHYWKIKNFVPEQYLKMLQQDIVVLQATSIDLDSNIDNSVKNPIEYQER